MKRTGGVCARGLEVSVVSVPLRVVVGCEPAFIGAVAGVGSAGGTTVSRRANEPFSPGDVPARECLRGGRERS